MQTPSLHSSSRSRQPRLSSVDFKKNRQALKTALEDSRRRADENEILLEELRTSEQKYRDLFQNSSDILWVHDLEGNLIETNLAFKDYGWTEEDLKGANIRDFVPKRRRSRVSNYLSRIQKEGHAEGIWTALAKDGTEVMIDCRNSLVYDRDGCPVAVRCSARDITEKIKAENEKRRLEAQLFQSHKMESVGRLAGGVAHDFNNVLGIIMGHAEIALLQADPANPLCRHFREILRGANRSAELVRQLLAFARRQNVSPKVLDLNKTVATAMSMLRPLIGEEIQVEWLPGRDLWRVRMDPSQIHQILANLLVNSRDAMPHGGRIVLESTNKVLSQSDCGENADAVPGQYVLLTVSDTGTGMSREVMEHLFDPFFTTKEVGQGTGLGLATVHGIVKQNKGVIQVESAPGEGAKFRIYLPRFAGEAVRTREEEPGARPPEGTETILLAEDDDSVLEVCKNILAKQGYSVLAARTPTEALSLANEYPGDIHLLITDVVMPEMGGGELLERLQTARPMMKSLFMSGYTADFITSRGVLPEGMAFLQKPFSTKALSDKVREVIDSIGCVD